MKELKVTLEAEEYSRLQEEKRRLEESCAVLEKQKQRAEKELISLTLEKCNLEGENKFLRWQLADLKRRQWGKSSEKRSLPEDVAQLNICFDAPVDVGDPATEKSKALKKAQEAEQKYTRFRKNFTKKIAPQADRCIFTSRRNNHPYARGY